MRSPSGEMKADLKKGSWSQDEDEILKSYINRYGIWNWSHMPKYAGLNRSGKSCRLRWMNYLKPNLKRGNLSKEEEEIILHYQLLLGNRHAYDRNPTFCFKKIWSKIASKLPGRSDNVVKNYWHTRLKKRPNYNSMSETTQQHDATSEASGIKNMQVNHANDRVGLQACEDHDVEFNDGFYDLCSPGTVKDVECFWKQLGGLGNLEFETSHKDLSFEPVFEYSYDEATGQCMQVLQQ
ncbi:hypothetical protein R6Q57_015795 [Mikania cordata]